jgi:hypothetical protein
LRERKDKGINAKKSLDFAGFSEIEGRSVDKSRVEHPTAKIASAPSINEGRASRPPRLFNLGLFEESTPELQSVRV